MAEDGSSIIYRDARIEDLESLETIVPRSFFAVNPFMKELLPDTPAIREWWRRIYEDLISNPNSYLPIAIDSTTNAVVGTITLDAVLQGQPAGGALTRYPGTEDRGKGWDEAIQHFAEHDNEAVGSRNRFLVEIMGVDSAYQGKGIGQRLVADACQYADAKGWPIWLETSAAKGFYQKQKLGFQLIAKDEDQGETGGQLLREPGAKG
ncbi:hypothetical protein M409DRAFT_29263 [Zasmidium cellare ATCC 36951]|uniref:N-acetyltransferase domain-containing protein n=1 Tax=Zasmidium cellare ATCC 36951 TaxID=1080233 RepID=A0A6A6C2T6_ZASCE|nr:uncharacterized protein M409DRAFT_29263 [Zasmidium cellare ATCC 36951]KAF2160182.1 hypothetical protein M409DRAFT_29263 [Zasmidium cellare ATCC 36951]